MKRAKEKVKRVWRMPSAFTIIFAIIAFTAALTWVVPSGQYATKDVDGDMLPVAGSYKEVEKITKDEEGNIVADSRQGLWELAKSPIVGTVGQSADESTGKQAITGGIEVMLFVLIIGGFLGITMKTGALDALFGSILKKLKGKEQWIIPALMLFFAIGGTTYGMQEETVAFYALTVPLLLSAGYNGMVAAMVIILGSGAGLIGSIVNPFSVGIASGFADTDIGTGIVVRIVIFVLALVSTIWFTMRYAAKVKAGEYKNDSTAVLDKKRVTVPAFTGRRKAVVALFGLTFVAMVLAVIPWAWKFDITFFEEMLANIKSIPVLGEALGGAAAFGDWWFNELSLLFLVMSFIIAWVYYTGNQSAKKTNGSPVGHFIDGAKDLLAVALIIGVARGVTVVMTNGQIIDTVIHAGEQILSGVPAVIFPALAFLVYLPLSIFIPSSSGLATATMPIMAPLANISDVAPHLAVTAYSTAVAMVNIFAPTIASVIGGLVLAKVSYVTYIRRTWKLALGLAAMCMIVLTIAAAL